MKVIIVGYGVQGEKRKRIASNDCVAIVDPFHNKAEFKSVYDVPLNIFESALVCTPDSQKNDIISYLLENSKNVLVEKPLLDSKTIKLHQLEKLAKRKNVVCYTAYNHRFEPHFINFKKFVDSKKLGKHYFLRMFYGNGTARLVKQSKWRDQEGGVVNDLASHILDTYLFWFKNKNLELKVYQRSKFENNSPDHMIFGSQGSFKISVEISMISWRNHFFADLYSEKGSIHIDSLCKWGPSTFISRKRRLPSGIPIEKKKIIVQEDPTWSLEYKYFKKICKKKISNLDNDIWIQSKLKNLVKTSKKNLS